MSGDSLYYDVQKRIIIIIIIIIGRWSLLIRFGGCDHPSSSHFVAHAVHRASFDANHHFRAHTGGTLRSTRTGTVEQVGYQVDLFDPAHLQNSPGLSIDSK